MKDTKWGPISHELRTRPGHWAEITDVGANIHQYASSIRHGSLVAFRPPGAFEAKVENGKLLARFVNPGPDGGS